MLASIIGFIPSLIKSGVDLYKEGKVLKEAKDVRVHELKAKALDTKLEAIKHGSESDMKLDESANQRIAWADDVSFVIFLTPCLLAFYPPALEHMQNGFSALEDMPEWYQISLGMMLVSVWGYRRIVTPIIEVIAKAYLGVKRS